MNKINLNELITQMVTSYANKSNEYLSTEQIQIIKSLCSISNNKEIISKIEFNNNHFENLNHFIVENKDNILNEFKHKSNISQLILTKDTELQAYKIIINFMYINKMPKYYYVYILYGDCDLKFINLNNPKSSCGCNEYELKRYQDKSSFFIKIDL